jgi:hypothetical protein
MKLLCFLVGITAYNVAFAQQSPALPPGPSSVTPPGISTLRPEYAPPPSTLPPRTSSAVDSITARQELTDLIRAQTELIKTLSSKVDSVEDRLRRMEGKLR